MNRVKLLNWNLPNFKGDHTMKQGLIIALLLTGLLSGNALAGKTVLPYFYPFVNPFEATVIPLPDSYKAELPEKIPVKEFELNVFPDRKVPKVFWYQDGLKCSMAAHKKKSAPMLFIIAGTGAEYKSANMVALQKVFYQAGFHVICISSPTHMNFVVNACSGMPGNTPEDAKDLYRVMMQADAYARKKKVDISGYALTGYSLGGIESAFLAKLDEERKVFNFDRVLLINPPSNVYDSITILNNYLINNIPGGIENFPSWLQETLNRLVGQSKNVGEIDFSSDSIYKLYRYYPPEEDFLKALIGLSFRMSSANMVFAVDVMNGGGYIVPKGKVLKKNTPLEDYAIVSYHTSFVDYFDELFYPYYAAKEPGLTQDALIQRASLNALEPYLKDNEKIALVHNIDDIIMGKGQVDYLLDVFGSRARVFPTGGHCGNMIHPDASGFMVDFLSGKNTGK